jgi:hypothetical protein
MAAELDQPALTPEEVQARIAAAKGELHGTVDDAKARVRYLSDPRNFVREHPIPIAIATATAVFLLAGGPRRLVWAVRGARRNADTHAYDRLPSALRTFVDVAVAEVDDKDGAARQALSAELGAWARDPSNRRRAKDLAREALNGPPGPRRALWVALEMAAVTAARQAARKGVGRLFTELSAPKATNAAASESEGLSAWSRASGGRPKAP